MSLPRLALRLTVKLGSWVIALWFLGYRSVLLENIQVVS
jgi:hypothetical protein